MSQASALEQNSSKSFDGKFDAPQVGENGSHIIEEFLRKPIPEGSTSSEKKAKSEPHFLTMTPLAELAQAKVDSTEPNQQSAREKKPYIAEKLPERKPVTGDAPQFGTSERELPNLHQVDESLFRSGSPESKEALQKMKEQGVTSIIDFRSQIPLENVPDNLKAEFEKKNQKLAAQMYQEKKWCDELGLKYYSIPMTSGEGPSEQQIDKFLELAKQTKAEQGKMLAHDEHGSDREGAMMYTYRIAESGYSKEDARIEMLKYGYRQRENGTDAYPRMTDTIESWADKFIKKQNEK